MNRSIVLLLSLVTLSNAHAKEFLVKLTSNEPTTLQQFTKKNGGKLELVSRAGRVYKWTTNTRVAPTPQTDANLEVIQPNRPLTLPKNPSIEKNRDAVIEAMKDGKISLENFRGPLYPDNPAIPSAPVQAQGSDPLLKDAWGIPNVGADSAWKTAPQGKGVVVAVTDTGVDYTHQDLVTNMWHNKKEVPDNGIDDDNNGYVDDIVGWDFAANDNKPYDVAMSLMDILLSGGNPGHGTHVSGVIGAALNNGFGTAGVAPQVQIMALRFISEKGEGTTEAAIKAIDYAVDNGANIINASWGGEKGQEDDTLLQESLKRAESKGVLFIVAAGNGRQGGGFDNDSDSKPIIPASLDFGNMVCVAAIDSKLDLASFSNWGKKTCKIGAPGVKILSTVPGNRYQDTIINLGSMQVTWDGTSMATPFVVGSAAVLWSQDLSQTASDVRSKLLKSAVSTPSLTGKVETGGRVDLHSIR